MNLIKTICILLTLSGISVAEQITDDICLTEECVETAALLSTSIDHTVNPCDDFYQFSCGNWQKDHPKVNNLEGWSHFSKLSHEMADNLIKLLANSSVTKDPKYLHPLINFYKGCVNTNVRNLYQTRDFELIKGIINKMGGWPLIDNLWSPTHFTIEDAFIELNKFMISKLILDIDVIDDLRNNTRPILAISNPFAPQQIIEGIYRIPKEEENVYAFYDGVKSAAQLVAEAIKGSVIDDTVWQNDMKQIQALDMALRKIATPINNAQYVFTNYDKLKITVKDLKNYEGIDIRKILDGILKAENIVLHDDDVILADKDYLKNLGAVLLNASKRTIANMFAINMAMILGKFSTTKMAQIISTPDLTQLPYHCLGYTQQILPDLIGRFYMDKMFNKESANDMKEFIVSLKEAFHHILEENQWMDDITRVNSIKKLNAITGHIAFPEYASNDSELLSYHSQISDISENTFMATMIKVFNHQRSTNSRPLKDNTKPKGHWPPGSSGVIVNAFYYPELNGICATLNLGTIGMVISHELTHAFDNMGSLFDERGNLAEWFTNKSRTTFLEKTHCFVDQYSKFRYDMGNNVFINISGSHTLGENIADNGGVKIAFRALQLHKANKTTKLLKLPGALSSYSEEQLFFLSFANLWCSNKSPAAINNQITRDVHSIEDARVIGTLSNFPEFAKAFNCPVGSRMNPTNRCQLW